MRRWVFILPALQEFEEFLCSSFLEETHQRTSDCLHLGTGNFRYLPVTVDEATSDLLKLEVAGDIGVNENLGELSRSDDEFRDEIDSVVSVATKFRRRRLIRPKLAVELHE